MELDLIYKSRAKKVELHEGQITSLDSKYTDEIIENLSDITIIDNETLYFIGTTIESEIGIYNNGMEDYSITLDVLKELGLKNNFLTRKIDTLSFTEKIYLNILRRLSGTSKRVLFKDMYRYLDYRNQKNFKNLKFIFRVRIKTRKKARNYAVFLPFQPFTGSAKKHAPNACGIRFAAFSAKLFSEKIPKTAEPLPVINAFNAPFSHR